MNNDNTPKDFGFVTEHSLAEARKWIGVARNERGWNSIATEDAVWHYALGIGDDNPLWWDRSYAESTPWGRMFAPPLFLSTCNNAGLRVGEDGVYPAETWFPGTVPIIASERWEFERPLWIGETVTATARLDQILERPGRDGGRAATHIDCTTFTGDDGSVIGRQYKTLHRFDRVPSGGATAGADTGSAITEPVLARYTDDEIAEFAAAYEREGSLRRGGTTRYGERVRVGDSLGTVLKGPLTVTNIVGFLLGWGSPLCQTNRIAHLYLREHPGAGLYDERMNVTDTIEAPHWVPQLALKGGMPGSYDFGGQRVCWLSHLLTDWCGDDGFVVSLDARLRRPNVVGDTTWITGEVSAVEHSGDHSTVTCAVKALNQRGDETALATGVIRLPR